METIHMHMYVTKESIFRSQLQQVDPVGYITNSILCVAKFNVFLEKKTLPTESLVYLRPESPRLMQFQFYCRSWLFGVDEVIYLYRAEISSEKFAFPSYTVNNRSRTVVLITYNRTSAE